MMNEYNYIASTFVRAPKPKQPFLGRTDFWMFLLAYYLLSLGTFQNFLGIRELGRDGPEFDVLSAIKVAGRVIAFMLVAAGLVRARRRHNWHSVRWHLFPLAILGFWGAISALWSPMPLYSFGHAMDLILLVMIAALTGLLCDNTMRLNGMLRHVCTLHFAYLLLLIGLSLVIPTSAQILRENIESEKVFLSGHSDATSIIHFATMAGVATLGLVLVLASRLFWRWRWARILFAPALIVNSFVLFLSQTRSEIGAAVLLVGTCLLFWGRGRLLAVTFLLCGVMGTAFLLVSLGRHDVIPEESIRTYVTRGQSKEALRSLGNRTEVWSQVVSALLESPLSPIVGHGYSMPTPSGTVYISGMVRHYPPHNLFLFVLAGTGFIGATLFFWGFSRLFRSVWRTYRSRSKNGIQFLTLLILVYVFFVGIIGNPVFGPITLKSISIFVVIGMGIGSTHRRVFCAVSEGKS